MNPPSQNPFTKDSDRREIWDILMRRDFEAFLACDWSLTSADFLAAEFLGVDGCHRSNPDHWRLTFPTLESYRDEWLRQARDFSEVELIGVSKLEFLYQAAVLRDIEIAGARAIAHKKFDGAAKTSAGGEVRLDWQSLYFMKKHRSRWRIIGFVGYLKNPATIP